MTADRPRRREVRSLGDLLDRLGSIPPERRTVAAGELVEAAGRRSFGALIMAPAIISFTPLGMMPGVPSLLAVFVAVIAAQVLIGRKRLWLPQFIARREVSRRSLARSVAFARQPARMIDALVHPRLTFLTGEGFVRLAALLCIAVALVVPPLDFVPFGDAIPWIAIGLFGLALIAHDGLLAIAGLAAMAAVPWLVGRMLI